MKDHWFGYLTVENIDTVAAQIRKLLTGRRYTFVAVNSQMPHSRLEVRASQCLAAYDEEPVKVWHGSPYRTKDDPPCAGFNVHDSYGSWGASTTLTNADAKNMTDEKVRRTAYVSFDPWPYRDQIHITQFNGYGELLHWVIAVEDRDGQDG